MTTPYDPTNYRRALISKMLLEGSSGDPIQSWTQGANRIAQALVGGMGMGQLRAEDAAARQFGIDALGGGPVAQALANPATPPHIASVLAENIKPKSYSFMTASDGTIYRTDPKYGAIERVGNAPKPPTYGIIGEDPNTNSKQYGWIDPSKQTVTPNASSVAQPAVPPSVTLPSGEVVTMPPGADPKKWREHVTTAVADAQAGKATEVQQNSTQFANRMENAEKNFASVETANVGLKGVWGQATNLLPGATGKFLQPSDLQKADQAKSQFITALLRKESGAAINKEEFARYDREFFPQPGDGPEVISQKRGARIIAIEAMKRGAGPVYRPPAKADAKDLKAKYGLD